MSSSIELLQIDRRHEGCRVRDSGREARLLANIAQRGIERPLAGVWKEGTFPVHAYLYTLRQFMRVNGVSSGDIEQFIRALAGEPISLRDIQLLADSCFRGPAALRQAILQGQWRWSLQQIKDTLGRAGACSAAEQQLLRDLGRASKLLVQLASRCANVRYSTPAFLVEADLLAGGLLSQLPIFHQSLERLRDRSRNQSGHLETA